MVACRCTSRPGSKGVSVLPSHLAAPGGLCTDLNMIRRRSLCGVGQYALLTPLPTPRAALSDRHGNRMAAPTGPRPTRHAMTVATFQHPSANGKPFAFWALPVRVAIRPTNGAPRT